MYAKRVQIINYGPIGELDIEFPFDGDVPKPVVLVGANGSGKSILLSHIVNGLVSAKDRAFPETPELSTNKVFKVRDANYIKGAEDCYFSKVDFEEGIYVSEVFLRRTKENFDSLPPELKRDDAKALWEKIQPHGYDHFDTGIRRADINKINDIFSRNCVLYFPSNRFEQPAWLNEENLNAQAEYADLAHVQGSTTRRIINYSPLRQNQNWLFSVAYDQFVFEGKRETVLRLNREGSPTPIVAIVELVGPATRLLSYAMEVAKLILQNDQFQRFGIGYRHDRKVSIEGIGGRVVLNIFQLSSGEIALLNMFYSILRDFDLCGTSSADITDVRGIVVVDEIDLHLHAAHQYEILPALMRMFPKVQFIVTTHSPLLVLGMANTYGEDGFALYRMPQGQQISPEEFTEFGDAYRAFSTTSKFSDEIRAAVRDAQSPILYVEGKTDVKYLRKAAELLCHQSMLSAIAIDERGGGDNLRTIWKAVENFPTTLVSRKVVLLHDCDYTGPDLSKENRFRRTIPAQAGHPLKKGIENLFTRTALEKALSHKPEFIDIIPEHPMTIRGQHKPIPEQWVVNEDEKTKLCDWLCENGTVDDFKHFQIIFDILAEVFADSGNEECSS